MLSRKYYRMLARVINNNSIKLMPNDLILKSSLINDLSNELKKDNINFNYSRFKEACNE